MPRPPAWPSATACRTSPFARVGMPRRPRPVARSRYRNSPFARVGKPRRRGGKGRAPAWARLCARWRATNFSWPRPERWRAGRGDPRSTRGFRGGVGPLRRAEKGVIPARPAPPRFALGITAFPPRWRPRTRRPLVSAARTLRGAAAKKNSCGGDGFRVFDPERLLEEPFRSDSPRRLKPAARPTRFRRLGLFRPSDDGGARGRPRSIRRGGSPFRRPGARRFAIPIPRRGIARRYWRNTMLKVFGPAYSAGMARSHRSVIGGGGVTK